MAILSSESPLRLFFPHKPRNEKPYLWVPLCLHLPRVDIQETSGVERDLQPPFWIASILGSKDMALVSPRTKELLPPAPRPLAGFDHCGVGLEQIADRRRIETRAFLRLAP